MEEQQNIQEQQVAQPEAVEETSVDWQNESKKFQSMYDRQTAENSKLKEQNGKFQQLAHMLESRPDVVQAMRDKLSGDTPAQESTPKVDEDSFDPWEAYSRPGSESYKLRQKENEKLVSNAVKKQMAGLQMQMGMQNLKNELGSKYGMTDPKEIDEFVKFAMTPKDRIPIDTLVDVYRKNRGVEQQNMGANENLEATQRAQAIPKSAGILQGAKPEQKSNLDDVWKKVVNAGSRSNVL